MNALFMILCILAYIVIGILAAMMEVKMEIKDYGKINTDDCVYVAVGIFWPMFLVFAIVVSPIFLFKHFLEWYGDKLKEGKEE